MGQVLVSSHLVGMADALSVVAESAQSVPHRFNLPHEFTFMINTISSASSELKGLEEKKADVKVRVCPVPCVTFVLVTSTVS